MALTDADRLQMVTMAVTKYSIVNRGGGEVVEDSVYPTIITSGYVDSINGVSTITGTTTGNFLLAFLCSRSEQPIVSAPGWEVWGGYAPIKRTDSITQRIWVLTKRCEGNDSIEFVTNGVAMYYIIWYEFAAADINWHNPISIPLTTAGGKAGDPVYLSKNINKLIIWAGHAPFFMTSQYQPIWVTNSGLPIIGGRSSFAPPHDTVLYGFGTLADTTKVSDWGSSGIGPAQMCYTHRAGGMCSIMSVAINHA